MYFTQSCKSVEVYVSWRRVEIKIQLDYTNFLQRFKALRGKLKFCALATGSKVFVLCTGVCLNSDHFRRANLPGFQSILIFYLAKHCRESLCVFQSYAKLEDVQQHSDTISFNNIFIRTRGLLFRILAHSPESVCLTFLIYWLIARRHVHSWLMLMSTDRINQQHMAIIRELLPVRIVNRCWR